MRMRKLLTAQKEIVSCLREKIITTLMSLLGNAVLNQSHHIGLQQLETMAAATRTFLGASKCYKIIQDEESGETVLVCSCYRLLEHLQLSGSVAQLLNETIRAHWLTLRTGTASLLFLAGAWSRVALDCLHQGISILHIIAGMSKGLEVCLGACAQSAMTVESVVCKADLKKQQVNHESQKDGDCMDTEDTIWNPSLSTGGGKLSQCSAINSISTPCSLKDQVSLKLKHSRHFNSNQSTEEGDTDRRFDITRLAEAVCHGCETTMKLVIEASRIQCRYSHDNRCHKMLDIDKLVTCLLPGLSEEHMCVFQGYAVLLPAEQALLVKCLEERRLKISLVHGDLTETHRHVGFNKPKHVTYVSDCSNLTGISQEEKWMTDTLKILLDLKVDIVLVSGRVTQQLKDHCLYHHILIIEHVRVSILNHFATLTGALPVSYLMQLSERCIGSGVCLNTLRSYCTEGEEYTVVSVFGTSNGTSLVTALITSSVHSKLQSIEDQFWSCAYRLHHALKDGKLLPGAGITELICIHQLYYHKNVTPLEEEEDEHGAARRVAPYEQVIMRLMAESWMDYVSTLMVNTGRVKSKTQTWTCIAQTMKQWDDRKPCNNEMARKLLEMQNYPEIIHRVIESEEEMLQGERVGMEIYDNMTVKFEVWRKALDLVFLILRTDTEIVTGIDDRKGKYKDAVIL